MDDDLAHPSKAISNDRCNLSDRSGAIAADLYGTE